jgi:hypothetical protein
MIGSCKSYSESLSKRGLVKRPEAVECVKTSRLGFRMFTYIELYDSVFRRAETFLINRAKPITEVLEERTENEREERTRDGNDP